MKKHVIFAAPVLALGDIYTPDGSLITPVDGVIGRLKAVCRWIWDHSGTEETTLFFASAGFTKRRRGQSQRLPVPGRPVSLADQLFRYLSEQPAREESDWIPAAKLEAAPLCWSTRNEIRVAIHRTKRWMKSHGYDESNTDVTLVVSSHWAHLPRIWLYCKWYLPRGWKYKLVRAKHKFSAFSRFIELPKIIRDIAVLRAVRKRFKKVLSLRKS